MPTRVFVYGTLRHGEVNHHLLAGGEFRCRHVTPPRYRMLNIGRYPGVVEGGSTAIVGEVYQVDGEGLVRLDKLEAYPKLYTRKLIATPAGRAWIYLYRGSRHDRAVIPSGDWCTAAKRLGPFSLY